MIHGKYKETHPMAELISDQPGLLQLMARFGLPLGVGDKTVAQVCEEQGVDAFTFVTVANFIKQNARELPEELEQLSVNCLTDYLRRAHTYFLDFQLPAIRRKLLEALDCSRPDDVSYHILRYYDDYMEEVRKHMQHENKRVFAYVARLLQGEVSEDYSIERYARVHGSIDTKLQELKNIIIRYYAPSGRTELLHSVLFDIFTCENDLRLHCLVEDSIFVPAVRILEARVRMDGAQPAAAAASAATPDSNLSEREREVLHCVVCGMSNKEIAGKLFISLNTVLTHRKNIARKLGIHSVAGLTIYAVANHLVDIEQIKK